MLWEAVEQKKSFMDIVSNFDYSRHSVTVAMVDHFGIYVAQLPKRSKEKYIFEHVSTPVWKRRFYGSVKCNRYIYTAENISKIFL